MRAVLKIRGSVYISKPVKRTQNLNLLQTVGREWTTLSPKYPCVLSFNQQAAISKCLHTSNNSMVQLRNSTTLSQSFTSPSQRNSFSLLGVPVRNLETNSNHDTSNKGTGGIPFRTRAIIVATISGLMGYGYWSVNRERQIREEKKRYEEFRKAQLGGDWVLTDQNGKQRSSTEFRGQWVLMYFGFSHCPDICPEELEKLIRIVKSFDADSKLPNMLPVFITLDPDRDTPSVIKDYLADLKYPRLEGFTGTEKEIGDVAKKFRAYFKKGPVDEDNDYIVDHTIIIYLINPKGEFVNYYDRSRTAEVVIKSVTEHVNNYLGLEKISS